MKGNASVCDRTKTNMDMKANRILKGAQEMAIMVSKQIANYECMCVRVCP